MQEAVADSGILAQCSHIEPDIDEKKHPEVTGPSNSDNHVEQTERLVAKRLEVEQNSSEWFFSCDLNFKHKGSEESGIMYAKSISIYNTVASGYIHIECGKTFTGVATNSMVYLVHKGIAKVTLGGDTQSLKQSQFFLIIPEVPFTVENKSKKVSVHLSYV